MSAPRINNLVIIQAALARAKSRILPDEPIVIVNSKDSILPSHELTYFFSDPTNKKRLLEGIDAIWKSENLFLERNQPAAKMYTQYISLITSIAIANKEQFTKLNGRKGTNFFNELIILSQRSDLSELQKSIGLTQALELSLLGINPTPVLLTINQSHGDHSQGFRNELQAAWFLAKFIYELPQSEKPRFSLQEFLPILKRDRKKNEVYNSSELREVDIHADDALVSVKSGANSFPAQIRDLFFFVVDDKDTGLKNKIGKLILIKTASNPRQYSPGYSSTSEYKGIQNQSVTEAKELIKSFGRPSTCTDTEYNKCLNWLVSTNGIELYFMPHVNDFDRMKDWIKQNYDNQESDAKQELIA